MLAHGCLSLCSYEADDTPYTALHFPVELPLLLLGGRLSSAGVTFLTVQMVFSSVLTQYSGWLTTQCADVYSDPHTVQPYAVSLHAYSTPVRVEA